jgi:hypothetical protein
MPGLSKSKVDEFLKSLRGNMLRDDDIPRIENLLRRNIDESAEDDEENFVRPQAMDAYGRRLVRPASAAARREFDAAHGIAPRKIRNLG